MFHYQRGYEDGLCVYYDNGYLRSLGTVEARDSYHRGYREGEAVALLKAKTRPV